MKTLKEAMLTAEQFDDEAKRRIIDYIDAIACEGNDIPEEKKIETKRLPFGKMPHNIDNPGIRAVFDREINTLIVSTNPESKGGVIYIIN